MKWLVFSFIIFFFRQRYISYSLRTADAFPVVASLPPKNSYFNDWRERRDERKCVCCSQATFHSEWPTNMSHLIYYFLFTVENVIK